MITRSRPICDWQLVFCLCAAMLAFTARGALAAPINYGNVGPDPPGVTMYLNVTESSATDPIPPGRFGPPQLTKNLLDFDPTEFVAFATAGNSDITDVQLNFTMMTLPGTAAESLSISERGDYTLFGGGTDLTQVAVGAVVQVDILEVDGVPLPAPLNVGNSNSMSFNLINDPGVVVSWSNGLTVDFLAALNSAEIPFELGVTKAKVVIDNQLLALSEPSSIAFIAKKDFSINIEAVPEPTSLALVMMALAVYGVAFRRRILRALF